MKPQIHIGAGLGGIFPFISYGTRTLDKLIDEMSPSWDAYHHLHTSYTEDAYKSILKAIQSGPGMPQIILGGHSMGVFEAIKLAWRLHGAGIPVEYLFAIDPTALNSRLKRQLPTGSMTVPMNVKKADEFWATGGLINFPKWARMRAKDGSRGGKLVYTKEWTEKYHPPKIYRFPDSHIGIGNNPEVHKTIIRKIREIV